MKVIEVTVGVNETELEFPTGGTVVGVGPWYYGSGPKIPLVCMSRDDAKARTLHIKVVESFEECDLVGFEYVGTSIGKSCHVYHVFVKDE